MGMMPIKKLLQPTAAKNAGVKRVVLFNTIAVYGSSDNVGVALQAMRDGGYWIGDSIVDAALKQAGET